MPNCILNNTSYGVLRTNPKLTTNVKLVTNGTDLYLESFDVNTQLSNSAYKAFKISGNNTYDHDVYRFYNAGVATPSTIAYQVYQKMVDTDVCNTYSDQYDMFYSMGVRSCNSKAYNENMSLLFPLWLKKGMIPNYFVIFKISEPAAINFVDDIIYNNYQDYINGLSNDIDSFVNNKDFFEKYILNNAEVIKTFDMRETSKLGGYLRRYVNQDNFPESPITVSWRDDEPWSWNGISFRRGGFSKGYNHVYNDLITKDATLIQNDYYITQGFERNEIICANLINLEFLFDDETSEDYTINRYFGLYVNECDQSFVDIDGKKFLRCPDVDQTPRQNAQSSEINKNLESTIVVSNPYGVLLGFDEDDSITLRDNDTITPSSKEVGGSNSLYYIQDKFGDFHSVLKCSEYNRNTNWDNDKGYLRIKEKSIDISKFTGFKEPECFANAKVLERGGKSMCCIEILDTINNEFTIEFDDSSYIGNSLGVQGVSRNSMLDIEWVYLGEYKLGELPEEITDPSLVTDITNKRDYEINDDGYYYRLNTSGVGNETSYDYYRVITHRKIYGLKKNTILNKNTNEEFTLIEGTQNYQYFCKDGSPEKVAFAIADAINIGIPENKRFFKAKALGNRVYVESKFYGQRFNSLTIKLTNIENGKIKMYQSYENEPMLGHFIGGTSEQYSILIIDKNDHNRFSIGKYVKTKNGYAKILGVMPYMEEPVYFDDGVLSHYANDDKYETVYCDKGDVLVSTNGQVALYEDFKNNIGAFSIFPVKDFNYDFHSDYYRNCYDLSEEIEYYTNEDETLFDNHKLYLNPDINYFYDNIEFSILKGINDKNIDSNEYTRLEENYIKELVDVSRVVPYINKWCWYNEGTDCRGKAYRLNCNLSFGRFNFSPNTHYSSDRDSESYSHEWYYYLGIPEYYKDELYDDENSLEHLHNYIKDIDGEMVDNLTNVDVDNFLKYFIFDNFDVLVNENERETKYFHKQVKYSTFSGGDKFNYAETLFRGVKVIAKTRTETSQLCGNNRNLSYKCNTEFNGYKFSCVIKKDDETYVKVIRNKKWKEITIVVGVSYQEPEDSWNPNFDRTKLYTTHSEYNIREVVDEEGNVSYETYVRNKFIDNSYITYFTTHNNGFVIIKGINIGSQITRDPLSNVYNDIMFWGAEQDYEQDQPNFKIVFKPDSDITLNIDNNTSEIRNVKIYRRSNNIWNLYNGEIDFISSPLYVYNGYLNYYDDIFKLVGFKTIYENINDGNSNIEYIVVEEDGSILKDTNGENITDFVLELRTQDELLKSKYVSVSPINDRPSNFNMVDVIGYNLSLSQQPTIFPIARHSGNYEPLTYDCFYFADYFMKDDKGYPDSIKELYRYKNTEFNTNNNDFGLIKNLYYHKVNQESASTVLELSNNSAYLSLYPLINEIGTDYDDFYTFKSNWDSFYFKKNINKKDYRDIVGTASMVENPSFFGSKCMKVPQGLTIETFVPMDDFDLDYIENYNNLDGHFMVQEIENTNEVKFYVFLKKRLTEYLNMQIKEYFEKHIRKELGYGSIENLNDDVNEYIEQNLLKLYKVDSIKLYVKEKREDLPNDYYTTILTDEEKIRNDFFENTQTNIVYLDNNPFDFMLIYNTRSGYSTSFGLSVNLIKK